MLVDYHTHTSLCKHASGEPEAYLKKAEELGIQEMGISDHCPWPRGYDTQCRMNVSQFPEYKKIVENLQKQPSTVKVRYGIEIDWVPCRMEEIFKNLENEPLDYILGSIHYVEKFPFDSPDTISEWEKPGKADWIWNRYADSFLDFVKFGGFDIIAHPDLPKKFKFYPSSFDYFLAKMDEALAVAAKQGMTIEINTCGLRKPAQEMYPSPEILKLAKKHNLPLTLASDAHSPGEVGANFKEAVELALQTGYDQIASFEKRKYTLHPLG